jgi:MFS family permease
MRKFIIIWVGQLISTIGSGLTGFALSIWLYQETGQAAPFVYTALFSSIPVVLFSLFAGAIVDRLNRRWVMILSDVGAALTTLVIFLLYINGGLEVWHIYVSAFLASLFNTFQLPAFNASITMLVPKEQLTRANGMVQTGASLDGLLAPILAGVLVGVIGVEGMMLIDFATFFFAVGALLLIHVPQPETNEEQKARKIVENIREGWRYLSARYGLVALAVYIGIINLLSSSILALTTPLILSFSTPRILGLTQMISSLGLLLGGILISTWGGTKRKVSGIYIGILIGGLGLMFGGLRSVFWWIAMGIFVFLFPIPTVNAQLRSIIQVKSPPDLQGRVFSVVFMIARLGPPLGYLISAPLAEKIFEPGMMPGGNLAGIFGPLFGLGAGRGIGLMMSLAGLGFWLVTAVMYAYPRLRLVEDELPDIVLENNISS